MAASFETLLALDARLVRAGHHPLTERWRETLAAFYGHPTAKTLVAQVGRGGAKSHTAVKIALNEALNGDWDVPPGEIHYFAFVSASKEEAAQRLLLIQSFLSALKLPHETSGDTVHLVGKRVGFRVFAQSVAAVSGFRCIGYCADECAKWRSASTAKNPASEVVTSLSAMTITHPAARSLLISSPWSTQTYHYKRVVLGDTAHQLVMQAASWHANPAGISERTAREKSDSEGHFRREYLAVASATLEDGFFPEETISRCIDAGRSHIGVPVIGSRYFCAVDPAFSAKGDLFGCAVVTSEQGKLDPLYQVRAPRITTAVEVHGWRATGEATPMISKLKSDVLGRYEISKVYSDRFEGFSFRDLAKAHGVNVEVFTGDAEGASTIARYKSVRTAMMDAAFRIPDDERLINELRAVASELSASGNELIRLPKLDDGSHCDRASALILAGSIALSKPAHLPVARMSRMERMERAARERKFTAMFTGGL
jgi:hypothetical protein